MLYVCMSSEGVDNALLQLGNEKYAELRIDLVRPSVDELKQMLANSEISYIATCRPGVFDEETSLKYLEIAAQNGAHYIDVEIERGTEVALRLKKACENTACKLIISYHNFQNTPSQADLLSIIDECKSRGADIVKIACKVNTSVDNSVLLSLYSQRENVVAFGMGALGKVSRLASLGCGAEFTYVASDNGEATAPGQFTVSEMKKALAMCR